MLYHAYEIQRAALELYRRGLRLQTEGLRSLPSPLARTLPVRAGLATADLIEALRITHSRPDFDVRSPTNDDDQTQRTIEEEPVVSTPFATLLRFTWSDRASQARPKVLIVPGLAGHFATLVRPTVSAMTADHEVYVVDWHNARDVPRDAGPFGLDEFIEQLIEFIREIGPGVHLMAICQPAVACIVAASVLEAEEDPATPSSLILLAGPVDTSVNPGRLGRFSQRPSMAVLERMALHRVPAPFAGQGRKVYPGFMQLGGFLGMDPLRHAAKFRDLYLDQTRGEVDRARKTIAFYREYFAVLDIAGEFYLDTVQRVFRDNDLANGHFEWRGRKVDPARITSSLFTIEGAMDELCTPGQTEAAHRLCSGIPAERHRHLLQPGVGHYGVFAGSTFEDSIYPAIREFIHDTSVLVNQPPPSMP
ncbi:polyhydroxyalkanoate depolymerase [Monashia sp. NPDC004114]